MEPAVRYDIGADVAAEALLSACTRCEGGLVLPWMRRSGAVAVHGGPPRWLRAVPLALSLRDNSRGHISTEILPSGWANSRRLAASVKGGHLFVLPGLSAFLAAFLASFLPLRRAFLSLILPFLVLSVVYRNPPFGRSSVPRSRPHCCSPWPRSTF